ncbi:MULTISPECIES: hypothetical protein [Psychrobacter]|uniref:Uncharacterized protein n=1 Tax=Psychrobacter piechaudii TaxID=1945521 RepID=A0A1R4GHI2_9GAMM|nr:MULTISPECIES: hypothetical protein [Psychrobacter]SJM67681.1 hypothetical protein A1232T_00499 [Psychrobacter piechaudii]
MLQVTDKGANITLSGKTGGQGNGVFWFAVALLAGALAVAMAMSLLPERLAIGALGLLIIGSYVFNRLRERQKGVQNHITSGLLKVQPGQFVHNQFGKTQHITLAADDTIEVVDTLLTITTVDGDTKCQVSGFDSQKEAQVMQAILQGQKFGKRNANIKMQSS